MLGLLGLVSIGLATARWWTRSNYPGYGRWALAGPVLVVSLFLLRRRPTAPDWLSMVVANAVAAFASMLYLEGAPTSELTVLLISLHGYKRMLAGRRLVTSIRVGGPGPPSR
jgi:hypothetical protein